MNAPVPEVSSQLRNARTGIERTWRSTRGRGWMLIEGRVTHLGDLKC